MRKREREYVRGTVGRKTKTEIGEKVEESKKRKLQKRSQKLRFFSLLAASCTVRIRKRQVQYSNGGHQLGL